MALVLLVCRVGRALKLGSGMSDSAGSAEFAYGLWDLTMVLTKPKGLLCAHWGSLESRKESKR